MTSGERLRIWLAPSAFHPSRGGVEELTLQLARVYQARGHEVTVVVHRHPADLPDHAVIEGVPVRRLNFDLPGSHPGRLLTYPIALRRQVDSLDRLPPPDVVHVQCASNQVLPLTLWTTRRHIPLVLTTQGEVTMDAGRIYEKSVQMRSILRLGSRRAAMLTACSRRAGDDAMGIAPAFRDCAVIPNGVDPSQWTVAPLPDAPRFAVWGRLVPQKGVDLAIQAFARVREQLPAATLRVGGDGPELAHLRTLAGPGVEFLGPLDRNGVQHLLDWARVAVVPSRLEPFGIVAVEAMACGRGVVWSTNGGLRDATGHLGIGVKPTDVDALAEAMVSAHQEPVPPDVARAHAESLDWERIAARYLELYHHALRPVAGAQGQR